MSETKKLESLNIGAYFLERKNIREKVKSLIFPWFWAALLCCTPSLKQSKLLHYPAIILKK